MTAAPSRLYKYLPQAFADRVVSRGDLLFRNLSYFRRLEDKGRADLLEGMHMDWPDNPITLASMDGKVRWEGRAGMLNAINQDRLLVFCCSTRWGLDLFEEFSSDACIEILNPTAFLSRLEGVISRQPRFAESGLLHGPVLYYELNRSAPIDITDPKQLPFCKHMLYSHQDEYRLALALRGGLRREKRIVNELFTFDEDLLRARPCQRHVYMGDLSDLVRIRRVQELGGEVA